MKDAATFQHGIIPPEAIAYKLAAWRNYKTPNFAAQAKAVPRLPEILWALQKWSMRPGGFDKAVQDFIAEFPERIGTPAMHRISQKKGDCTPADIGAIEKDVPAGRDWRRNAFCGSFGREEIPAADVLASHWENEGYDYVNRVGKHAPSAVKHDLAYFQTLCRKAVENDLARHLANFCTRGCCPKDVSERVRENDEAHGYGDWAHEDHPLANVWYFHDLPGALVEMMERQAARAKEPLADTKVARQVFDAFQYAWSEKVLARIEGDSRVGKTESVQTFCEMLPGRARLVRVPCSNSHYDLFAAFAEALGMEVSLSTSYRELKSRVEFIIRHGGLMFVLDESHFLVPTRISKNTAPMRLNWIRTQIVDHGCPLVLVTTPQDFKHSVDKFTRATGYNMTQFLGRELFPCKLPAELDPDDLTAVARKHFPELDEDYLMLIASKAMQSELYLKAVEAIGKRARYHARNAGRALTLSDLDTAIAEIIPAPSGPAPVRMESRPTQPIAKKRGRPAPAPTADAPQAPSRQTSPAPALEMPATRQTSPLATAIV